MAQPVFGQIKPSKRPGASRAEQQSREKMAGLGSARQEVGSVRRRKRKNGSQKRHCRRESQPQMHSSASRLFALAEINANSLKRSEEGRDYLSLKFDDPTFKMAVHSICKATRLVRLHPAVVAAAEERRVMLTQSSSRRLDWAGLGKDGQPRPRRAANDGRTEVSEDLSPCKRRHPHL